MVKGENMAEKAVKQKLREQSKGVKSLNDYLCPSCFSWTATERAIGLLRCSQCRSKFIMG